MTIEACTDLHLYRYLIGDSFFVLAGIVLGWWIGAKLRMKK